MPNLRDRALRLLYDLGWRFASKLPAGLTTLIISAGSWLAVRRGGVHLETLAHNLELATGVPTSRARLQAAVASYLLNFYQVLSLPAWDSEEVLRWVSTEDEDHLRTAFAGPGAVVALPHSGNWDLAGAWACATGMPVTTVAEDLGEAEFRAFTEFREGLGMKVLAHNDLGTIGALNEAVRAGRLVCLVADRDLLGSGLPVNWNHTPGQIGPPVTMPAGPAIVARRTGASLIPAVCQFRGGRFGGDKMVISFGPPIASRPGRDGLIAMTQQVADFFASRIATKPEDWHLMQPFFTDPDASDPDGTDSDGELVER